MKPLLVPVPEPRAPWWWHPYRLIERTPLWQVLGYAAGIAAGMALWQFLLLGAVLVGDSSIEATTASSLKEKIVYERFECVASGTVEEIQLYIVKAALSEPEVGIYAEKGAEEKPGELKGHAKKSVTVVSPEWVAFTGLSVAVTKGTFYWLAFLDSGVTLEYRLLEGTAKNKRKNTTSEKELKSNPTVSVFEAPEKVSIQALGTETGGKKTVEASVSITAGARTSATAVKVATANAQVTAGSGLTASVVKVATGTAQLTAGARMSVQAQRAVQQSLTTIAGTRSVISSVKVVPAAMVLRAGAQISTTAKFVATAAVTTRVGARVLVIAGGQKTVEATLVLRGGARTTMSAVKIATTAATTRTGARIAISAQRVVQASATMRAGAVISPTVRLIATSAVLTRAGAVLVLGVRETVATTVVLRAGTRIVVTIALPPPEPPALIGAPGPPQAGVDRSSSIGVDLGPTVGGAGRP